MNERASPPPREPSGSIVVQESFPDPLVYYMALQIQKMPGPKETCNTSFFDPEIGTEEHVAIDVPTDGVDEHFESYSDQELATFKTGYLSRDFILRVKAGEHEPIPRGILVRAMYLALELFRAIPTGRIVLTDNAGLPPDPDTLPQAGAMALRVQVRRDLEWDKPSNIRAGEITVRRNR